MIYTGLATSHYKLIILQTKNKLKYTCAITSEHSNKVFKLTTSLCCNIPNNKVLRTSSTIKYVWFSSHKYSICFTCHILHEYRTTKKLS